MQSESVSNSFNISIVIKFMFLEFWLLMDRGAPYSQFVSINCLNWFWLHILPYLLDFLSYLVCIVFYQSKSFRTKRGVIRKCNDVVVAPVLMWVKALDLALDKLRASGCDLSLVAGICGCAQVIILKIIFILKVFVPSVFFCILFSFSPMAFNEN